MLKYFNTLESPIRYNSDGQMADGHSWFETEETEEVKNALKRGDIFKIDSNGDIVYDSNEDTEQDEPAPSSEPLTPENTGKSAKSRKNLEG